MTCEAVGCDREAQIPHRLRETSGFEFPEEVGVCLEHKAMLEAGDEYIWQPTWENPETGERQRRLIIGDQLLNLDSYIVKDLKSIRTEMMSRTNVSGEEGRIWVLEVRRPGGPVEELELTVPFALEERFYKFAALLIRDEDKPRLDPDAFKRFSERQSARRARSAKRPENEE